MRAALDARPQVLQTARLASALQRQGKDKGKKADPDPPIVVTGGRPMAFSDYPIDNPLQSGTQQMVPSARDLQELLAMRDPHSPQYRKGWDTLTPNQAWALLAAEKKGESQIPRDKERAIAKLKALNEQFKCSYPTSGADAEMALDTIGKYIASRPIATNFNLSAPPGANRMTAEEIQRAPKSLADLLMEDKEGLFRQVWETATSQASTDLFSRGAVEEQFGYASAVERRGGRFRDPTDSSSKFEPKDKSEMPKYAALVSASQVAGVAPRYGASIIYWKDRIRSRVTHTPGDSWGNMGGRLYTSNKHPLPLIADGDIQLVRLMAAEATDFMHDKAMLLKLQESGVKTDAYFETQIHGKLSWDDVSHIVLNWGVFKSRDGTPLPKTSKADAENMKRELEKFAAAKHYDFLVRLGQEIKNDEIKR